MLESNAGGQGRRLNPFDEPPPPPPSRGSSTYLELSTVDTGGGILCVPSDDENAIIRFLDSGKVFGYPHTNGTRLSNYLRFVANNHPLLGICLCHRLNPFGKSPRISVYYCVACLAILLNYVLLKTLYVPYIATCNSGCEHYGTETTCQGGPNDGMSVTSFLKLCAFYSPSAVSSLVGTLLLPYGSLLRFAATCSCLQGRPFFLDHCIGQRLKRTIDASGGLFMSLIVFSSTIMLIAVVALILSAKQADWSVFYSFVLSKLLSALFWFVWTVPLFLWRFKIDKKQFFQNVSVRAGSSIVTQL